MQGFAIRHDRPYAYARHFYVPRDYRGRRVLLIFHGVYSQARVWVNGTFVRDHFGGFTKWSCDITDLVRPGAEAVLTVEITDRIDDISFASGYAKHQIGGILRNVELAALPEQHFRKLFFETDLDEDFRNAELKVTYELNRSAPATIEVALFDAKGRRVTRFGTDAEAAEGTLSGRIDDPHKWDAEHPHLYRAVVTLSENGRTVLRTCETIGFREISVQGNTLLVNGTPVHLRGANRHDVHPLLGRTTTPAIDEEDVLLAKEANINFIRTSHYPPSEAFLDFCDRYGIYVEDETAVCFVGSHRTAAYQESGASQDDPSLTARYLSQLEEMVQGHRNHPSVIIWSIGNENVFGRNFVESFKWVKKADPSRPVIYSYPGQVPGDERIYEILSMHYPDWHGDLDQYGVSTRGFGYGTMPVLFDEWAHVSCYNNFEIKQDPNVRDFWGRSLDRMWAGLFSSDGGLGGAIWGLVDETFMLPEGLAGFNDWWGILDPNIIPAAYAGPCVGYGEWGIVDVWRRRKPEFWNVKKAYSPTKITVKRVDRFSPGSPLRIPVHNRFDHTNFSELRIKWRYGDGSGILENVDLGPHAKGELVIPANDWRSGEKLNIGFFRQNTSLVDEDNIPLGDGGRDVPEPARGHLEMTESVNRIGLSGRGFRVEVDRKTGLLRMASDSGETLIVSGPYVNLRVPGKRHQYSTIEMDDLAAGWDCAEFAFRMEEGIATILSKGGAGDLSANFLVRVDGHGLIAIDYEVNGVPAGTLIQEAGLRFITGDAFAKLSWDRDSYFTAYPETHLGRPSGTVDLNVKPPMSYRQRPSPEWELDTTSFFYFGLHGRSRYTHVARALKENIFSFSLETERGSGLAVLSDGRQACRFDSVEGKDTLIVNDLWDYNSLLWGNYQKKIAAENGLRGRIRLKVR